MTQAAEPPRTVLVTGFPVDVARRLARELAAGGERVLLLSRTKFLREAEAFAVELRRLHETAVIEVIEGDILELDLGLAGARIRQLHAEIEEIHHIAAISYLGISAGRMRSVNVEGLRELLEVALGCSKLRRLCLWSTAFVAGARSGTVYEDELVLGQSFRNAYEQTKAEAEILARSAMAKLPITVVRPAIVIGDSVTGEVSRLDGPYPLIQAIAQAREGRTVPLPGRGTFPLHLVPVDYVVRAALYLTRHPAAEGGTYHLVDEAPLSARQFFDAVADAAGRPRPSVFLPSGLARAALAIGGLAGRGRSERTFVEWFDTDVRFDNTKARALLQPSGLRCPGVPTYIETVVRAVRERA